MKPSGQGWPSIFWLVFLLLGLLSGCRNPCETVEMALRAREQDLRVLKEHAAQLQAQNEALCRQLNAVQYPANWSPAGPVITPEYAANTYTLKRITLGRGTGPYDEDKQFPAKSVQVIIEPRDLADDVIKAPGSAQITALEVSPSGIKTPFSVWNISAAQMSKNWKQGIFNTGYVLVLPWQKPPRTKQVRIVVRFQLSDGRLFEADKDITINSLPMILPPPISPNMSEPQWQDPGEVLPIPQQFKPATWAPAQPGGSGFEPTANWQPPSLNGAVKMLAPVPLYPPRAETFESEY